MPHLLCGLSPGETIAAPEMHLGLVFGDLDAAVQTTPTCGGVFSCRNLETGRMARVWNRSEVEITVEQVNHAIEAATEIGEVFFIDASWYARPESNWWNTVGDWEVDRQRFPRGLKPFRDRVHAAGMLWGLWMDASGWESGQVAREHPDWLAMNYDGERKIGGLLDLTNPEAAKWMEEQIIQ
jgi:alpha-galactosidase